MYNIIMHFCPLLYKHTVTIVFFFVPNLFTITEKSDNESIDGSTNSSDGEVIMVAAIICALIVVIIILSVALFLFTPLQRWIRERLCSATVNSYINHCSSRSDNDASGNDADAVIQLYP